MKTIIRNSVHGKTKSYDCLIGEINNKKIKFVYEAFNGGEKCSTEFFDGDKLNHIFNLMDLGETSYSSSAYIWDEQKRKTRADDLFKKAEKMCNLLLK